MLSEKRRPPYLGYGIRHLDRIAHGQILAAAGVIDLDDRAGLAQRRLLGDLLHRQDRPYRNVARVADIHDLELVLVMVHCSMVSKMCRSRGSRAAGLA